MDVTPASAAATGNLVVRFATELCALTALGFWGHQLGHGSAASILLAAALPLAMAIVWGAVIAPRARRRAADPARLVIELGIFAVATLGIAAVLGPLAATGFALVVLVNVALMFVWRQRSTA